LSVDDLRTWQGVVLGRAVSTLRSVETKGFAVEKICEYLGIDKTKTKSYAFGDSHNDFELFSSSDYGIAMGNALPELYEEADFITNTNDEDGVANYIEKKILKGE
jgi:hydroxymethylpyrimidine pyrophosphatase-like HAD family hydrolase